MFIIRPDFANVKIKRKWVTGSLISCVIKDATPENHGFEKRNSALKRKKIRSGFRNFPVFVSRLYKGFKHISSKTKQQLFT